MVVEQSPLAAVSTPESLIEIASGLALAAEASWASGFEPHPDARAGVRIMATEAYDVWLLSWPADTEISPHGHGDSDAAFAVVSGELRETHWQDGRRETRAVRRGECVAVGRGEVHEVRADGVDAISVHVYAPPLARMEFFDDQAERVLLVESVDPGLDSVVMSRSPVASPSGGLDAILDRARKRIAPRMQPEELAEAMACGALVIDTRPEDLRRRDGEMDGAIVIDRNVLEWRLDPVGSHRIKDASDPDRPVVVVCDEGYASSLAAVGLLELGRRNVTDLAGGYQAWKLMTKRHGAS